ncbi:helix-turn-helix transcriptional regulator [Amycolatopsis anabasis]|uniref:helix-turn-helix transcriptional regulator n=1 Tax=Amycolatopsis anabasis TaxID=1840409 RepID=UPI00131B7162|nr:helix-turn-helix transcriptional regulator [Amycolatopsis anabasis]
MPRLGSGISLIARGPELNLLRAALTRAADGEANAVLVAGDAGVGKSRLLAELVGLARETGATVLTGRCLDVDEAGLPYLPFVEALGQLTAGQRAALTERPVLSRLVPGAGSAAPGGTRDQAMERLRLFDAVHGLLAELAADGCVLLALEDLHWADASTRDLVLFLLSRLDRQRLLVVATYRQDDLHRRHPLWPLLAELSRLPVAERLELAPFGSADAVTFVSALAEGSLPEATIRAIAERSEGNAFFCEELTAAHQGGGGGVSSGLAELLLARMERLSSQAQRIVRAASGAGQAVAHTGLRAVCELDDDVLEDGLREAVRHNVLVAADDGYTFRHALLREAVYDDLLPGERVRLHAGYARVAAEQGAVAALAQHSFKSHDLPTALEASVRAAAQAGEMRAPGEALHHLAQALQLWEVVPDPEERTGTDELSLSRSASMMASAAGEAERAVTFARSAVAQADLRGDPELAADARHQLAVALIPFELHRDEVSAAVDRAWELVRDRPPSEVRAKVLALRARTWVWNSNHGLALAELRGYAEQAIADARQVGAAEVEADALVTLAVFAEWEADSDEAIRLGYAAAERAAAIGAFDVELRALQNISSNYVITGRFREALGVSEQACHRAAEVGLTWGENGLNARVNQVFDLFLVGDWEAGLAEDDLVDAPRLARARVSSVIVNILVAQGRFDQADELAGRFAGQTEDARTETLTGIALAEAAYWRGRYVDATDRARTVLDRQGTVARASINAINWAAAIALAALADFAEEARRRGDESVARQAVADGEQVHARAMRDGEGTQTPQGTLERRAPETRSLARRMDAELSRLRGHDDPALWRLAAEHSASIAYWHAIARWRLGAALLGTGERDQAGEHLRAAHETAVRLGAAPLRDAVRTLARRARISLGDVAPAPAADVLTPRERAVLELVATGLTNKQIGARLFISEKTASVHLSRVMTKLGAASRTEAVTVAQHRGLL